MTNLTIIILTKNEEQNLEKCIKSFKGVAQRIVIVDSYSTDRTVELAKSLGAWKFMNINLKIMQHSLTGLWIIPT